MDSELKELLKVSGHQNLAPVNDIIHDCKFDKGQIVFDRLSEKLSIGFGYAATERKHALGRWLFLKKWRVPILRYVLQISSAESYMIHEGSRTGPGSEDFFNKIHYNPQNKEIRIHTIIAKYIEVRVKKLELSILDSNQVIEEKEINSI